MRAFRVVMMACALGGCAEKPAAVEIVNVPVTDDMRAAYPLRDCLVGGGKLGSMGDPYEIVVRTADGREQLVRFCCKGCVKDFKRDPGKFLAKLQPKP
jgi:hypothetical protein